MFDAEKVWNEFFEVSPYKNDNCGEECPFYRECALGTDYCLIWRVIEHIGKKIAPGIDQGA